MAVVAMGLDAFEAKGSVLVLKELVDTGARSLAAGTASKSLSKSSSKLATTGDLDADGGSGRDV